MTVIKNDAWFLDSGREKFDEGRGLRDKETSSRIYEISFFTLEFACGALFYYSTYYFIRHLPLRYEVLVGSSFFQST